MPTIKKPKRKNKPRKPRRWSNRQLRAKVYNSRQWRELRNWYIASHPLCERCEAEGRTTPATAVHHVISFTKFFDNGEITAKALQYAYDKSNLQALCDRCHKKAHGQLIDNSEFMD